jgi:hypothetical protein
LASRDQVRLVDDAARPTAAYADEDAPVDPVDSRDAVSIRVEIRKVYSLRSTSSPRPRAR